jgi:hypothetical protein
MKAIKKMLTRRLFKKFFNIIIVTISIVLNVIFYNYSYSQKFFSCNLCENYKKFQSLRGEYNISQKINNPIVSVVLDDYVLPAVVIAGKRNYKTSNKVLINNQNFENNSTSACKYSINGPRILCSIIASIEELNDVEYIYNTWGRR